MKMLEKQGKHLRKGHPKTEDGTSIIYSKTYQDHSEIKDNQKIKKGM